MSRHEHAEWFCRQPGHVRRRVLEQMQLLLLALEHLHRALAEEDHTDRTAAELLADVELVFDDD